MSVSPQDSFKQIVRRYLNTPLFFDYRGAQRAGIYLLVSLLIGLVAFAGSTFHPGTIFSSLIVGAAYFTAFGVSVVIVSEIRIAWLKRKEMRSFNLTIGTVWLLGLIIFLLGFFILGAIQRCLMAFQIPDLAYYFKPASGFMPFSLTFLLKMFPTWAVDVFLVNHVVLKKVKPGPRTSRPLTFDTVALTSGKNSVNLNPDNISHISIDQHYASIYVKTGDGLEEIQIKSSMKTILEKLPEDLFCRVHRSHAVNLNHVEKITSRAGNAYIKVKDVEVKIPVSRRQLSEVKTRFQSFTEQKLNQPVN